LIIFTAASFLCGSKFLQNIKYLIIKYFFFIFFFFFFFFIFFFFFFFYLFLNEVISAIIIKANAAIPPLPMPCKALPTINTPIFGATFRIIYIIYIIIL